MTTCQNVAQTVYDNCLPNTGPAVPIWFLVVIGLALVLVGAGTRLLIRSDEAHERALEAARRGLPL